MNKRAGERLGTGMSMLAHTLVLLMLTGGGHAVAQNLMFQGSLLDAACQLDPGSMSPTVTLPASGVRQFNRLPGRSGTETFSIRLVNCSAPMVGKVARLSFSGTGEAALPGYVAVNGGNTGRLGIGIIDTDGSSLLSLGNEHHSGKGDTLTGSTLTMTFKAFVQATPEALAQQSVVPGDYDAMVNFTVAYQ